MNGMRVESIVIPSADLGPENPLPPLAGGGDPHAALVPDPDIPAEDRRWIGWGGVDSPLPHLTQDGFGRCLAPRAYTAVILTNEHLRATFLPELGGRLWSLVALPTGRELLYVNRAVQYGNLALRNAWFAGGVEWSIGLLGHSAFTCSPIFAARVDGPDGSPALRMWEWERVRGVPFQIDAALPPGSPVLLVHVTIANPHRESVPMYWWSNIAVAEASGVRVLAPADRAYTFAYGGCLRKVDVPVSGGSDLTYPDGASRAIDYFFRIDDRARPWIATVAPDGTGLAHTSTALLRGRKLFCWGTSRGGHRWQEYLCGPDRYFEIQAGLARTQAEHLPMPAGARWSWTEAYGPVAMDAGAARGRDWDAARAAGADAVERMMSAARLDAWHRDAPRWVDAPPREILVRGSGWGALERRRREAAGADPASTLPGSPFPDDCLAAPQREWLELLERGAMSDPGAEAPPASAMVQADWRRMLERCAGTGHGAGWLAWNHLGIARAYAGDLPGAEQAFTRSLAVRRTAWALRNLAALRLRQGAAAEACGMLAEARGMAAVLAPLAMEHLAALLAAGRPEECLSMLETLPDTLRGLGRIRLLVGRAALAIGDLDRAAAILDALPDIPDMREGEVSLSDLWFGLRERRIAERDGVPIDEELRRRVRRDHPPPPAMDFRVSEDA